MLKSSIISRQFLRRSRRVKREEEEGERVGRKGIPKGCVAVSVGQDGEEQERFVVPVEHVNHPLFVELLREVEEEYGFQQQAGPIAIPCDVYRFRSVQDSIRSQTHHHHHHWWRFN